MMCGVLTAMVWQGMALAAGNCQLQISNRTIDYGQMTRAELLERQASPSTFSLGKQSMTLTATCRQPALITLFFRGAAADGASYRFGNGGSFTLSDQDEAVLLEGQVGAPTTAMASSCVSNSFGPTPAPLSAWSVHRA